MPCQRRRDLLLRIDREDQDRHVLKKAAIAARDIDRIGSLAGLDRAVDSRSIRALQTNDLRR